MSEKNEGAASFEETLEELETIVAELESGAKPLDESLLLYEKGIAALRRCHAVLDTAEKRIKILVRGASGEPELRESDGGDLSGATVGSLQDSNDSETSASESGQKTAQQSVDSGGGKRQNRAPSSLDKPASAKPGPIKGGPKAGGGSLFGSSQQ